MNRDWIARVAASAAIRKVVYIAVAAIFALFAGIARADNHPDEGYAYQHAMQQVAVADASQYCTSTKPHKATKSGTTWNVTNQSGNLVACTGVVTGHQFGATCSVRSTRYGGIIGADVSGGNTCTDGCKMSVSAPTETFVVTSGLGTKTWNRGDFTPTGGVCTYSDTPQLAPPKDDFCETVDGGHKVCADTVGKICVISAKTGRKYCGTRTIGMNATDPGRTESVNASPATNPATNPTPTTPRPGENFQPSSTSTTTHSGPGGSNPTTTTTVINNNTGTPNPGGTPTTGDGSGNRGTAGNGEGTGEGDGEGDDKGGPVGDGVGDLYEGEGRTVGDAFNDFQARVGDAPLIDAAGDFFTVSAGGACPTWTIAASDYWASMTFDYHCSGTLASLLTLCGFVLLAVAAFAAFRIAVY